MALLNTSVPADLQARGIEVTDQLHLCDLIEAGYRIFVFHEQDEEPLEAEGISDTEGYAYDQMLAY